MQNANCKIQNVKDKGFSISEVLIAIGVIAILCAVAWPVAKSLQPSLRLNSVARDLAVNLLFVQQTAVAEQTEHGLRFSLDNNSYDVLKFVTATTTQIILHKTLPVDVLLFDVNDFTNQEVVFNVLGAAEEEGTILIKNNKGDIKTIEVRPSGFVRVQ